MRLQGERSVGSQQLDQVRQVRLGLLIKLARLAPLVRVTIRQVLPVMSRSRPG